MRIAAAIFGAALLTFLVVYTLMAEPQLSSGTAAL